MEEKYGTGNGKFISVFTFYFKEINEIFIIFFFFLHKL